MKLSNKKAGDLLDSYLALDLIWKGKMLISFE